MIKMTNRLPNPRHNRPGLWSTMNGAIRGGWGPTLRMLVLILALGGILITLALLGQPASILHALFAIV